MTIVTHGQSLQVKESDQWKRLDSQWCIFVSMGSVCSIGVSYSLRYIRSDHLVVYPDPIPITIQIPIHIQIQIQIRFPIPTWIMLFHPQNWRVVAAHDVQKPSSTSPSPRTQQHISTKVFILRYASTSNAPASLCPQLLRQMPP